MAASNPIFLLAAAVLLAGCSHTLPAQPLVTGNQGGRLPGMGTTVDPKLVPVTLDSGQVVWKAVGAALTPAQQAALQSPPPLMQTFDQKQADGSIHREQTIGRQVYDEQLLSATGVPLRVMFYDIGGIPLSLVEYDAAGRKARVTAYFSGTSLVQHVEEYDENGNVPRFADYWPSGRARIFSEANVALPGGLGWRVEEWYENGQEKSLVQRDAFERFDGRQTAWDENGTVLYDVEYRGGVVVRDYLAEQTKSAAVSGR